MKKAILLIITMISTLLFSGLTYAWTYSWDPNDPNFVWPPAPSNNSDSTVWTNDVRSPDFMIDVWQIYPWIKSDTTWSENIANWILWNIIQNMMIALWALSILVMTIWAWYMILHSWQEDMLSRWKTIFMSWIYAMVIALASYYLIAAIRFLLYSTT